MRDTTPAGRPTPTGTARRVGVPLSGATGSTAPWEAATALLELLARRPDITVDLLATDEAVLDDLADHPIADDPRVQPVDGRLLDDDDLKWWLRGVDLVLVPLRRPVRSTWIELCVGLPIRLVSVAGPGQDRGRLTAGYPVRPGGMVDADEVADALVLGLDAPTCSTPTGRPGGGRSRCCGHGGTVYGRAAVRRSDHRYRR